MLFISRFLSSPIGDCGISGISGAGRRAGRTRSSGRLRRLVESSLEPPVFERVSAGLVEVVSIECVLKVSRTVTALTGASPPV